MKQRLRSRQGARTSAATVISARCFSVGTRGYLRIAATSNRESIAGVGRASIVGACTGFAIAITAALIVGRQGVGFVGAVGSCVIGFGAATNCSGSAGA